MLVYDFFSFKVSEEEEEEEQEVVESQLLERLSSPSVPNDHDDDECEVHESFLIPCTRALTQNALNWHIHTSKNQPFGREAAIRVHQKKNKYLRKKGSPINCRNTYCDVKEMLLFVHPKGYWKSNQMVPLITTRLKSQDIEENNNGEEETYIVEFEGVDFVRFSPNGNHYLSDHLKNPDLTEDVEDGESEESLVRWQPESAEKIIRTDGPGRMPFPRTVETEDQSEETHTSCARRLSWTSHEL